LYLRRLLRELPGRRGRVLPGVSELLERLESRGDVALGLLTGNAREAARMKLEHFGLDRYFPFGGFGDRHVDRNDVAKDALGEWRRRRAAGDDGEQVWVVGDTPLDVRCARSIRALALAVATGAHTRTQLQAAQPDLLLSDLRDPTPLFRALG
jgi:phosphoglycolate phosphatase-like HAD superfamily hydrolase